MDVGCYQTHCWLAMLGHDVANPVSVDVKKVTAEMGPTGVDLTTAVTAVLGIPEIASPVSAAQMSSFVMPAEQTLKVQGEAHPMRTGEGEAFTNWKAPSSLFVGDSEERFGPVDPFQVMLESVGSRICGDNDPRHDQAPIADSLRAAEILDQIRIASQA